MKIVVYSLAALASFSNAFPTTQSKRFSIEDYKKTLEDCHSLVSYALDYNPSKPPFPELGPLRYPHKYLPIEELTRIGNHCLAEKNRKITSDDLSHVASLAPKYAPLPALPDASCGMNRATAMVAKVAHDLKLVYPSLLAEYTTAVYVQWEHGSNCLNTHAQEGTSTR